MDQRIILSDADNTLWDTDAVFAGAQLQFLEEVEAAIQIRCTEADRLDFVRRYDQELALQHHLHFRYPPIMLVFALSNGLTGMSAHTAATAAISGNLTKLISIPRGEEVVSNYQTFLNQTPPLLPGVVQGLRLAAESELPLYVITEGMIEKQRKILDSYNLSKMIRGVFEISKSIAGFERLKQRFAPSQIAVIGDQPDRDITPAKIVGLTTVAVPSRFRPAWNCEDEWADATYIAANYYEAVKWIQSSQFLS
uniref:Haloacid dehalogenase domain protein hydrolase n=1 Tax=Burkholderia sp. (strain CCGE1003) TaxID=640512 RepID=E1T3W8_BURSG